MQMDIVFLLNFELWSLYQIRPQNTESAHRNVDVSIFVLFILVCSLTQ